MSEAQTEVAVPEWDLADRMRKALRTSGWSVQQMADYLEVAPTTVSTWINGRNRPSPSAVRLWAMRCGVPYEWLIGEGLRRAPISVRCDDPLWCPECEDDICPGCAGCSCPGKQCTCYAEPGQLACRSGLGLAA